MRRWRSWLWRRKAVLQVDPAPPEDVRLVYPDGTEVPVECRYDGVVDGLHHWSAVTPGVWIPGMLLKMEMLPGRTKVSIAMKELE